MNLSLKLEIQKYLEIKEDKYLFVSKENYEKYLAFYQLESDDTFKIAELKNTYEVGDLVKSGMPGDENTKPFMLTQENWTEDVYHVECYNIPLSLLYKYDIFHYFDLIEGTNHLVFNSEKYIKPMCKEVRYDFLEKWEYSKYAKRVVISHANCNDGNGVVEVVKLHNEEIVDYMVVTDIEIMFLDYNSFDFEELLKNLTGKLVYVGDFSFNLEQLNKLKEVVEDIVIVDHHQGVYDKDVSDDPHVMVDTSKSGARLAWEFFFTKDEEAPYIIKLIEDRDLWNFFYGNNTKALTLMIKKEKHECINQYMSLDNEVSYVKLIDNLEPYLKEVEQADASYIKIAKQARPYNINGITFHGMNLTSSVSEILNHVSKIFNTPSFAYWEDENGMFQLSFRNKDESVRVDKIAQIFGGDGHSMASGSKINFLDLDLDSFFLNKHLNVKYYVDDEDTKSFFYSHGIGCFDYVTSANCDYIIKNSFEKTFHDLFVVKRDKEQNLIIVKK